MKSAVLVAALSLALPATTSGAPRQGRTAPRADGRPVRGGEPLHVQLARAVFPRERWERQVSAASLEVTRRLTQASEGRFRLDPDFADRLSEEYQRLAPYEELITTQARVLHQQYTRAELRQLLAFYRSPLGKKSVLLVHDLTNHSDREMQRKAHAGMSEALGRLTALVHPVPPRGEGAPDTEVAPELSAVDPEARDL